ncbi:uncharacterized protein ARMOST_07266 [Armillaria ostoyae]|uniref:VWFA domain-containing protein n=1 Tax=Armillaria ostoyae TaxID=47428 RepID=A0A284R5C5_ARMOS|nr:uncharacterized protein ARMOST_07266 [Armillaria ostoyae]
MDPLPVPSNIFSATDTTQMLPNHQDAVRLPIPGGTPDSMDVDEPKVTHGRRHGQTNIDPVHEIPRMYRLLDLVSEPGSVGLVDKIIIDQDSLKSFANDKSPGAYVSLTKVDFNVLDRFAIKPVGVYGSKEEIIRFISTLTVVDPSLAQKLLRPQSSLEPSLRSGLYALNSSTSEQLFVIYWPEDTTWNDDAISAVRTNRITFMRYLTKVCDQLLCMISSKQSASLVWKETSEDPFMDLDDNTDRLFTFEVHKTNEQEENVTMRPGFKITSTHITCIVPDDVPVEASLFHPRMLNGEANQAFVTVKYKPSQRHKEHITKWVYSSMRLRALLTTAGSVCLNPNLTDKEIGILIEHGLAQHYSLACKSWKSRAQEIESSIQRFTREEMAKVAPDETAERDLAPMLRLAIVKSVLTSFPTLNMEVICPTAMCSDEETLRLQALLTNFIAMHPMFTQELQNSMDNKDLVSISSRPFTSGKNKILVARCMVMESENLSDEQRRELIENILSSEGPGDTIYLTPKSQGFVSSLTSFFHLDNSIKAKDFLATRKMDQTDAQFLSCLNEILGQELLLQEAITKVLDLAEGHFRKKIDNIVKKLVGQATLARKMACRTRIDQDAQSQRDARQRDSRKQFIDDIGAQNQGDLALIIDNVAAVSRTWTTHTPDYQFTGAKIATIEPSMEYTIHTLSLSEDHRHRIQMDSSFLPTPHIEPTLRLSPHFNLPLSSRILYMHLLASGKCLLIVDDNRPGGNLNIYLEQLSVLDNAIQQNHPKKLLHKDKLGESFVIAFDEIKRMLLLCASSKLHVFVFDETHSTLQGWGSAVNLAPWYASQSVTICHACFVCGSEEILLIDSGHQARVFSLITQQFRPAALSLVGLPRVVYSSPDGACLLLAYTRKNQTILQAYHWNSFGSSHEITLQLPAGFSNDCILSSFVNRNCIHLISLDEHSQSCSSVVLDITKKITEFQFQEKGGNTTSRVEGSEGSTRHNSLIECFSDVWTRFPVVAAVQHSIGGGNGVQAPKALTFATDRDFEKFGPHFSEMVQFFELKTRKPTNDALRHIEVRAVPLSDTASLVTREDTWPVSQFPLGAWLVNLFCLIPIHIAITRENRFLPLKDGVVSVEWEKSLLGAEVGKIIDSVSLGWYESIFQSYMAKKPVRVVSSMGEQSVGKSYTLNHLVDSSFAGSAMRTTEGVWLSVTPTDEALIVALDFEGVHSIERSIQEDTLLVLFNTAISNLVLFRNNFALSRDITGLFQSFQSSSTVLDPAANPSLFQSTLVIVIKDVTDIDKAEIVREFSTKFQQIVQDEQDANFISRLHSGRLNIVPWPIIESKSFYSLFLVLRKRLDQQALTHPAAGEFLLTLKTLMAKLKANDWGALSQSLVAHRAQRLLAMLPNALMYGYTEVDPEPEPLKNFDTDILIDGEDNDARFFLDLSGKPSAERELALDHLRSEWQCNYPRQEVPDSDWAGALEQHLQRLADARIDRVQAWIGSNLSRFTATHATITELNRAFDNAQVDLRSSVALCRMKCSSCNLLCVGSRRHDPDMPHDCQTSHQCTKPCEFIDEHTDGPKLCGFPAAHTGKHICTVDTHLCGQPCRLYGKIGCLGECTKMVDHLDDHMCSARNHACALPTGKCKGEQRTVFQLQSEVRDPEIMKFMYATIVCAQFPVSFANVCAPTPTTYTDWMCKRYISAVKNILAPQYVRPMEVVRLTRLLNLSKRRSPAGMKHLSTQSIRKSRKGSLAQLLFQRVDNNMRGLTFIAQIRTLSTFVNRGHVQQEHETSHGSMSKTRWAVDGPAGTSIEINGHKFGTEDDGAPMMCNLVCQDMGRHAHLDYCRADPQAVATCGSAEIQHVRERLRPNPERPKDFITHSLFWRRSGMYLLSYMSKGVIQLTFMWAAGFKDPYSRDDKSNFAKCDAMCPGPEHAGDTTSPVQLSYCTLPLFHPPETSDERVGLGYLSNDGHVFSCQNPVLLQQAFHVMFVIDRFILYHYGSFALFLSVIGLHRSSSMRNRDRRPLKDTPVTASIQSTCNNRLGAVYSALHAFWVSRHAAVTANGRGRAQHRRDSYSVILFDKTIIRGVVNDFTSSPQELLNGLLQHQTGRGTDYNLALNDARTVMAQNWSAERTSVVILLSDGECSVEDETVQDLCHTAVALGKPLSLHTVSFGPYNAVLRRITQIALDVQNNAPPDPNAHEAARVDSSYAEALDSVRLAETFLGIAESLRKPRGSLLQ